MRAIEPYAAGVATNPRDGVRVAYEVFGPPDAARTIVLLPTWSFAHSRHWKMQVPYFAQQGFRVVTFDGRGNGKSERPSSGYTTDDFARDALAVFDAAGVERAALVGFSAGARWGLQLAAEHPERVSHLVVIGAGARLDGSQRYDLGAFLSEPPDREGWNKENAVHWREDFPDFARWFSSQIVSEPHSTKLVEDFTSWALETTPETLIATIVESATSLDAEFAAAIHCPTLIIHGSEDGVSPLERSTALHEAIAGSSLVVIDGGGHAPHGRNPVRTNLLIHDFLGRDQPRQRRWRRAMTRTVKRALYVSSPIGLGHVQRDIAIARELRALVPGLEIDWLAQPPVTTVLEARGERIHPLIPTPVEGFGLAVIGPPMEAGVGTNAVGLGTQVFAAGDLDLLQGSQIGEDAVDQRRIAQGPEVLGRLRLGAVGWQRGEVDALGHGELLTQMPAGLIEDQQDVFAGPGADMLGELGQRSAEGGHTDGGQEQPVGLAGGRADEAGEIRPLVAGADRDDGTLTALGPDPAQDRLEAEPMLIFGPELDRRCRVCALELGQLVVEFFL